MLSSLLSWFMQVASLTRSKTNHLVDSRAHETVPPLTFCLLFQRLRDEGRQNRINSGVIAIERVNWTPPGEIRARELFRSQQVYYLTTNFKCLA